MRRSRTLRAHQGAGRRGTCPHTLKNPGMDYNGDVVPLDLLGVWRNFRGKRRQAEALFPFGWGDGGGGPSEKMLENYSRLQDFPALPRLRMPCVDDFFAWLPKEDLPVWAGELYLELHRGTLTTQGEIKKLNREAEHRLLEAEAFATIASLCDAEYPREGFDGLWKMLLLNQFHDILSGTSIREVNDEAREQLGQVVARAEELRDGALRHRARRLEASSGAKEVMIVANAALSSRSLRVPLDGQGYAAVTDIAGNPLPVQGTEGEGLLTHASNCPVPGLGWTTVRLRRSGDHPDAGRAAPGARCGRLGEGAFLENKSLRVEIGADGTLHRVYNRRRGARSWPGAATSSGPTRTSRASGTRGT